VAVPVAGQIIRASDVLSFEDAKPRVHAYDSVGNVLVNPSTIKLILFDSEMYDSTGTMHTGGATSRLVAPVDGLYRFNCRIGLVSATYTAGLMNVRQNAAGASGGGTSLHNTNFNQAGGAGAVGAQVTFVRALVANDYLEVFASQTSGANQTTVAGAYATFAFLEYVASS